MTDRGRLAGKRALITGASRNIGRATALAFAREGADLLLVSRMSPEELEAVVEECRANGVRVFATTADVSRGEDVSKAVMEGSESIGPIDILVSNAAIRPHAPITEVTYEDWRQVMSVNLDAAFHLVRETVPGMIDRGSGSIVAIARNTMAPMASQDPASHVAASKYGLYGFMQALSSELGPYGVRANVVMPGITDTERRNPEWYSGRYPGGVVQRSEEHLRLVPMGRPGTPEEVAETVLYLASDEASYVTGVCISCSGGFLL